MGGRLLRTTILVWGTVSLCACSSDKKSDVRLELVFPSTALAIATEQVQITVFEDPTPEACQRIYLKHITNDSSLPPLAISPPSPPVNLCDVILSGAGSLDLGYGHRSVLVSGRRGGAEVLVGCTDVDLESGTEVVTVSLAIPKPGITAPPPLSNCLSVRDFCEKRCP